MNKNKLKLIALISTSTLIMNATPVHAEGCGLLEVFCWTGLTRIGQQDADRRVQETKINADRDTKNTEIKAQADLRIAEANNALQLQIEAGKITVEQAKVQMQGYIALINSQRDQTISASHDQAVTNIEAMHDQAKVAIAGIQEAGMTTRERLVVESVHGLINALIILVIVVLLALVGLVVGVITRKKKNALLPASVQNYGGYAIDNYPIAVVQAREVTQNANGFEQDQTAR